MTSLVVLTMNAKESKWLKFQNEPKLYQNFNAAVADILTFFPLHRNLKSSGSIFLINVVQYIHLHDQVHGAQVYSF